MKTSPPPLLVSFKSAKSLIDALPSSVSERYEKEIEYLIDQNLPPAVSVAVVSIIFGVSSNFIASILRKKDSQYRTFTIKKGTKRRKIEAPKVGLKIFQSWIGNNLSRALNFPECVFGFIPEMNGVFEAANVHCESEWVYSLDLRDFFNNISREKVKSELIDLGYSAHSSELITIFCTYQGRLPQGSPASPILSNIVFKNTDSLLLRKSKDLDIKYTRYADDLVFSGINPMPAELPEIIKEILLDEGWTIAEEKEHISSLPNRLKVHGLLVHGEKPRLTKGYRNRIRAYKHLMNSGKIKDADLDMVNGHITYAESLDKFNNRPHKDDVPKIVPKKNHRKFKP